MVKDVKIGVGRGAFAGSAGTLSGPHLCDSFLAIGPSAAGITTPSLVPACATGASRAAVPRRLSFDRSCTEDNA